LCTQLTSLSPTALTVLEFDPASGVDLICIKSALSVLDIEPPGKGPYTTNEVRFCINLRLKD
jgi:predicted ATP-grasp superfamily ATP-dependent carboligase